MRDHIVDVFSLPYGMHGVITIVYESRNPVKRIARPLRCDKKTDLSVEKRWYCGYLVAPGYVANKLGWVDLEEKTYKDLPVHGGCTLAARNLFCDLEGIEIGSVTVGWDYHHRGDSMDEFDVDSVREDIVEFAHYTVDMLEGRA